MRSESEDSASSSSLAARVRQLERSPIREMYDLAHRKGGDLVHLEIGEPDFDTPEPIVDAATNAAAEGETHYTSNAGMIELRDAITEDITGEFRYDPENEVIVTAGAMEALALSFLTVVGSGEEIVIPTPLWPNYRTHAAMAGGTVTEVPLSRSADFALDVDAVTDEISERTSAIVLTRPSNPTGRVYDSDAIARVVAKAAQHDAYVIADEVYKDIVYDSRFESIVDTTHRPENVVTVGSCSKTYAMTGWRVGWLAAPTHVIDAATKVHESTVACAPSVSQHAALAALTGDDSLVRPIRDAFRERKEYLMQRVEELPEVTCVEPEGAFYLFLDLSCVDKDSTTIARELLNDHGVVTAPGAGFGSHVDDHLRISFANTQPRLNEGFERIESYLRTEGIR